MKRSSNLGKLAGPLAIGCGAFVCVAAIVVVGVFAFQQSQTSNQATAEALISLLAATSNAESAAATAAVAATDAAAAVSGVAGPTATSLPTRTPDFAATQAAEALVAPIKAALPNYGVDPNTGFLGWMHPPASISLDRYLEGDYALDPQYQSFAVHNFVVQADVTWETRTGLAGCGFAFRAATETDYYGMGIARGAQGVAVFSLFHNKKPVNDKLQTEDAAAVRDRNGDTNTLAVVGIDNTFTLYVNNQFTEKIADDTLVSPGLVAFAAFSESGTSICNFNNGWLWVLD